MLAFFMFSCSYASLKKNIVPAFHVLQKLQIKLLPGIDIVNHVTSLPIWLIQLQGIDKNMKLIWLTGVKEPTGECHKQWMVTAWRKINDRGWSQSRVLLGSVTLFLGKSCLLALVVWSKGELDRFNDGGYDKDDSWNKDAGAKIVWLLCRSKLMRCLQFILEIFIHIHNLMCGCNLKHIGVLIAFSV